MLTGRTRGGARRKGNCVASGEASIAAKFPVQARKKKKREQRRERGHEIKGDVGGGGEGVNLL